MSGCHGNQTADTWLLKGRKLLTPSPLSLSHSYLVHLWLQQPTVATGGRAEPTNVSSFVQSVISLSGSFIFRVVFFDRHMWTISDVFGRSPTCDQTRCSTGNQRHGRGPNTWILRFTSFHFHFFVRTVFVFLFRIILEFPTEPRTLAWERPSPKMKWLFSGFYKTMWHHQDEETSGHRAILTLRQLLLPQSAPGRTVTPISTNWKVIWWHFIWCKENNGHILAVTCSVIM